MKKTKPKAKTRAVAVRLPEDLIETMEALIEPVQSSPEYYGKVSVSTASIVRMAIIYGVEVIKQKYPA